MDLVTALTDITKALWNVTKVERHSVTVTEWAEIRWANTTALLAV